ncbi:tRNA pseudouridine(55) synthase TruB [Kaistia dalseonensis]|uniref:tRNA pseudouridine synthase B n=1 Tax=Kaistia dalseonensis TaxID=410840 RepID=A0ABU0H5A6_9HYPH|nr:tRNA pseudouridine(55) synthase TruB [Kaistia dalseonensis]MCX5494916.1 tRNA pseudouridine(55) synthase TruB [Kaistia dalseonensis]MDQ0437497.1 tRNA pseudouridine55 synthase [Kaistia dalseonensis]
MNQRKKKGRPVSGWLILDKPLGMTSTQAVSVVKRLFGAQKAGHAGTLDPLATGCLPIALGEATKTVPYVMDGRKIYGFTVRWGEETTTDDAEGQTVALSDARPTRAAIEALLPEFTGEIMQTPPAFSAIKIDGERAYDLARDGEEVVLEARPIQVHRLELVDMPDENTAVFAAECGKGTYVRALARDMGRRLGVRGHVVNLRRLLVGPFDEASMVKLDDLRAEHEETGSEGCDRWMQPVERALAELTELRLSENDAFRIRNGQSVLLRGRDAPAHGETCYATVGGSLLAIGAVERGEFQPLRVFVGDV